MQLFQTHIFTYLDILFSSILEGSLSVIRESASKQFFDLK